ncbi:hypothetical protein BOX15_Mlig009486g1 [Macrostomum lignano]|uniref:WSC domain-containing protein n=1 Tax=Macrostomum lignano TaxID=282301 RepID=A0A267GYW6_9PLAT|nr:hypothetical protein BOX15_Mlig009486g1 [Macrostomum lignano]
MLPLGNGYSVLNREIKEDFKYMSQRVCASHCLMELGSKYFGLADGRRCLCGNKIQTQIIPKYYCNASCFNYLYHKKCGGRGAIEVFDLKPVPKIYSGQSALDVYEPEGAPIDMQPMIPAPSKGCYHWGNGYSVLNREIKEDFKYMSQRVCASHCLMELGSKYFGLADGRRCLCGNKIQTQIIPKYYCNASCFNYLYHKKCGGRGAIEVFDLKPVPKIYSGQSALDVYEPEGAPIDMQPMIPAPSKGCYHWGNGYSVLNREIKEDFKYMSQRVCASHCLMETRWKYFGLADGRRCLCGNKIQSQIIPKYYCNASCFNYLYHKKCGGRGAIEVFDLKPVPKIYSGQSALDVYEPEGAPIDMQPMIPAPSKGCYLWYLNGDHRDFALKYEVDEDFKYMSQRVCATHCLMEKTWKYFGLFDGRRCFCGDEIRSRNVLNLICNVQCYNYLYGEKCGGRDAMEIFDLVPVPKNYSGETA